MTSVVEHKKLQKFLAVDRPPRKRLHALNEFLRLYEQDTDVIKSFWGDHANTAFLVLGNCIKEFKELYLPQTNAFGKLKRKTVDPEDWTEFFKIFLELIKNSQATIAEGWQNDAFLSMFKELLLKDNMPFIRQNTVQLLVYYCEAVAPEKGREGEHVKLLEEAIDYSSFAGPKVVLPDRPPGHVEGWVRTTAGSPEEPINMLKFILDHSVDATAMPAALKPRAKSSCIYPEYSGDLGRFHFWCDVIMTSFFPILYPKKAADLELKKSNDTSGFFHHCPGSFQRLVARWLFKLKSKSDYLEELWKNHNFVKMLLETLRQRFLYRDNELITDAIQIYTEWCTYSKTAPKCIVKQLPNLTRVSIVHVGLLLQPTSISNEQKQIEITLSGCDYLDKLSQQLLDEETHSFFRKAVISMLNDSFTSQDNTVQAQVWPRMISVVFHVWMFRLCLHYDYSLSIWEDLTTGLLKSLVSEVDEKGASMIIDRWKLEMISASRMTMKQIEEHRSPGEAKTPSKRRSRSITSPERITGPTPQKASVRASVAAVPDVSENDFELIGEVKSISDAILLLDRILHVIPPVVLQKLPQANTLAIMNSILEVVSLWKTAAILPDVKDDTSGARKGGSTPATKSQLRGITPSTLISIFGEWFIPICNLEDKKHEESRNVGIKTLCTVAAIRTNSPLRPSHVAVLVKILIKGLTSKSYSLISTIMRSGSALFSVDATGMNLLIPAFIIGIQEMMRMTTLTQIDLKSTINMVFAIASFTARYPKIDFIGWSLQLQEFLKDFPDAHANSTIMQTLQALSPTDKPKESSDTGLRIRLMLGKVLQSILEMRIKTTTLKQMSLWGLYSLVDIELLVLEEEVLPSSVSAIKKWIMAICDACSNRDNQISLPAIQVATSLAEVYGALKRVDASLISHVLMNLSLLIQQQIEEASLAVRSVVEGRGRSTSMPSDTPPESSLTRLKSLTAKTVAIFLTIQAWIMKDPPSVLADTQVCQIIFTAIEAALVGHLPEGPWQQKAVPDGKTLPLLLLGLQMRASLEKEEEEDCLKYFREISAAAEGLLLHLMHHFHAFPTASGPEQMGTPYSEFEDIYTEGNSKNCLHFAFMNSMIITVHGLIQGNVAKMVFRDASGAYVHRSHMVKPKIQPTESNENGSVFTRETMDWLAERSRNSDTTVDGETLSTKQRVKIQYVRHDESQASMRLKVVLDDASKPAVYHNYEEATKAAVREIHSSSRKEEYFGQRSLGEILPVHTGLFEMHETQLGVGSLDGEVSLVDLLVDSISLKYPDCNPEISDKTLLGGQFILRHGRYDKDGDGDKSQLPPVSLFRRILHDFEAFKSFRNFASSKKAAKMLSDEEMQQISNCFYFCEAFKAFHHQHSLEDQKAVALKIYWEFFNRDGQNVIPFPPGVADDLLSELQGDSKDFDSGLLNKAIDFVEDTMTSKLLDAYVKATTLEYTPMQLLQYRKLYAPMESVLQKSCQQINAHSSHAQPSALIPEEQCLQSPVSHLDYCRLLLSQLGFLPLSGNTRLCLLENSTKLLRSLKHLDQTPSRETMRIGIVYVKRNQWTQSEILGNTEGSEDYHAFLRGLGWVVELGQHQGFRGGLDCNPETLENGKYSLYYANSSLEAMFHVVTMMPTKPSDPQHIDKKRHVGNDFVHIVWNENQHDYIPTTISSHVNDVQIVIHPLQSSQRGMYRLKVFSKGSVAVFGPLMTDMIVSRALLPHLARQTAINATRTCRLKTPNYTPPYVTRQNLLRETSARYSREHENPSLVSSLFFQSKETSQPTRETSKVQSDRLETSLFPLTRAAEMTRGFRKSGAFPLRNGYFAEVKMDPTEEREVVQWVRSLIPRLVMSDVEWSTVYEKNQLQIDQDRQKSGLLYSVRSQTTIHSSIPRIMEAMMISKTTGFRNTMKLLMGDTIIDGAVLYHNQRSEHEQLSIKWMAMKSHSLVAYDMDLCLLEYSGIVSADLIGGDPDQEIGIVLFESIEQPECTSMLESHKLERQSISTCGYIFKQSQEKGLVEATFICSIRQPTTVRSRRKANRSFLFEWAESLGNLQTMINTSRISNHLINRPKVAWVADNERHCCNLCLKIFSQTRRKHHCRVCGEIICGKCSTHTAFMLPSVGLTQLRLCKSCCDIDNNASEELAADIQASNAEATRRDVASEGVLALKDNRGVVPDQIGVAWLKQIAGHDPAKRKLVEEFLHQLNDRSDNTSQASEDSAAEEIYDLLCDLASQALDCNFAVVSLAEDNRQWFKSKIDISEAEIPRDISFCEFPIRTKQPLVVMDALEDSRFQNNPFVTGELKIRFVAGAPLFDLDGKCVGSVTVLDRTPRSDLPQSELKVMEKLAHLAMVSMQERQEASQKKKQLLNQEPAFTETTLSINSQPVDEEAAANHNRMKATMANLLKQSYQTSQQVDNQQQSFDDSILSKSVGIMSLWRSQCVRSSYTSLEVQQYSTPYLSVPVHRFVA